MTNISDLKPGNLLEIYTDGQSTEFANGNKQMQDVFSLLNIRTSRGFQKVITVVDGKINGASIGIFEAILLNDEWLTKINAIRSGQSNLQIGKLHFKRTQVALLYCDDNFEPVANEKIINYVHQLQNFYKEKTGEDLAI